MIAGHGNDLVHYRAVHMKKSESAHEL
jgi:hypothetical protein